MQAHYDNYVDMIWMIELSDDMVIRYMIEAMELEYSKYCNKDILQVKLCILITRLYIIPRFFMAVKLVIFR